jgi:hypothetical protein
MSRTVFSEHLATIEEKIKLKLQMALIEEEGLKSVELHFLVKKNLGGWEAGIDRWAKVHFKPEGGEMFAHTIKLSYKDRTNLEGVIVVDSPLVLDSTVMVDFHNHVGVYADHLVMLKIYDVRGTAGKVMAKDAWPDLTETREVVKNVFQQAMPELPDENTVVVLPYIHYQVMDMDELLENLKAITAAIENKAKGVRK